MEKVSNFPLPPGQTGLPIIGETIAFFSDRNFLKKRQEKYGSIFKTQIFGRPTIVITGAEGNYFLLTNENKSFISTWPSSTKTLLGETSLAVQNGSFHTARRKLLYQAFQPRALASYLPEMEKITAQYLERWKQLKSFVWYPELRNYTLDIACKLLINLEQGSQTKIGKLFKIWDEGLFSIPITLPWTKFGRALKAREELLKEIELIILQRQKSDQEIKDSLGILLKAKDEEGNQLTLEELKDQILLLLFAGHETLTSALSSFCLLMCQHLNILEKIQQEQDTLNLTSSLNLDQLKQMVYLEKVLKEVLRLIPPVGGGFREVIQNCEFQGYTIPKGWIVQYQISRTHQDTTIYPNPAQFDPDRFSIKRAEDKQQPFGYIPFGGGIRECLGKEFARLEMKIFASLLTQNCTWQLLPNQDLSLNMIPTPKPKDGLKVILSERKD
ncbi:cytochrome P450 [Chroococcus sp. FPU101]|uniref:cytochrome P450 n=1 Tax=Chroococcus sp. FPU101 TaxID=1974212 RepID=UPI001A8E196B|nr:cytochrome P450 [Chroococcus sp. FPU101]GFE70675.1 cytochrome P450 [Chroococcus sp. FPU101]